MKKTLFLFAVFGCLLIVLTPMVSSVEVNLVKDEIENKINNSFLNKEYLINLFKNILVKISIKNIIKFVIFLIFFFPIFFLFISISSYDAWSYFSLFDLIKMYFFVLSALFAQIIDAIFGIDSIKIMSNTDGGF